MVGVGGLSNTLNQYGSMIKKTQKKEKSQDVQETKKAPDKKIDNSESKLSAKAQDFLKKLREKYKDYDFIVANEGDDKDFNGIPDELE